MMDDIEEHSSEERKQLLINCLEDLKEKDLEILEMRFFEKRPFAEIASILDITESNAKVRTYRVVERLKKIMLKRMST